MASGDRELVGRFWSGMSRRALLTFLAAVFFTFAAVGFLVDVANVGRIHPRALAVIVPFSGLVAVAFALIGMIRRYWLFVPAVALQVLVPRGLERLWPAAHAPLAADVLGTRMLVDAVAAIAAVALGYTFFMAFIVREGTSPWSRPPRSRRVLAELTRPNTFATAAVLAFASGTRLAYALAGHPPILHWRSTDRSVARLGEGGMALGILPGERYVEAQVDVSPGDLLAVLTDGFPETMDRKDRELGLEPIETALAAHAEAPLPEILDRLLGLARAHGPQQDDRTMLLVRVRPA